MAGWTDEERAAAIKAYLDAKPTGENTMDIVKEIAENMDKSINGVRMILKEVYVKKVQEKGAPKADEGKETKKRVSKQDSMDALTSRMEELGAEVNEEIISKLTGKAAVYFLGVINSVVGE